MKDQHDKVTPDFPEVLRNDVTEGRDTYPDMEGDFIFTPEDKADLERSDGDMHERDERYLHFVAMDFEDAMKYWGLKELLEFMTKEGQDELLRQAHIEWHKRNNTHGSVG